jgi:hypothetical protein
MEREKGIKTDRRPYRKPQLENVRLVAEEAVLTGCKFTGSAAGGGHPPAGDCMKGAGASCVNIGS